MSDLTEFLLARIAEDEQAARDASPPPWQFGGVDSVAGGTVYDQSRRIADLTYEQPGDHDGKIVRPLLSGEADANGHHIARHDPARVLRGCEAKREIVEDFIILDDDYKATRLPDTEARRLQALIAVSRLAAIYADHPEFDDEWRP